MKWQTAKRTRASAALALLAAVIRVIERDAEELDPRVVRLSPDPLVAAIGGEGMELCASGVDWELGEEEVGDSVVRVERCEAAGGRRLSEIYEEIPLLVPRLDGEELRRLARITSEEGVEYMIIYANDGTAYMLEGDEYSVTVPSVPAVGRVHTHPEGSCGLSSRDARSAAYSLADLSLFEAAATESCYFYAARIGFLAVEEYAKLLNSGDITRPRRSQSLVIGAASY